METYSGSRENWLSTPKKEEEDLGPQPHLAESIFCFVT